MTGVAYLSLLHGNSNAVTNVDNNGCRNVFHLKYIQFSCWLFFISGEPRNH